MTILFQKPKEEQINLKIYKSLIKFVTKGKGINEKTIIKGICDNKGNINKIIEKIKL